ncbi:MAG TPA: N-acetylmuramoyl-L-alanine amidase [Bacteroidales bacterium]|nr:N-acetylmuramoyl-L-alanine amidase [Bacteroidales bacterium]
MKILFTLSLIFIFCSTYAQLNLVELSSHYESETSLIEYQIDESIERDSNGGYGFKLKTPYEFTSFAIGWKSTTENYGAGVFEIVFKVHKPGYGWSDWIIDEGFTKPDETRSGYYKSDIMFGIDEYLHDSLEFYIHSPEGEEIQEIYLIIQDISKTINPEAQMITVSNGAKTCPEFPAYIPRSEWCGSYDACHNPTYTVVYRTPTHTVIHHGASPTSYTDGYAVVRSYWNYHVNSNGWSDIGYNYLFDKYGNFFQGRHNPNIPNSDVHAAHAGYSNTYSIGCNFLGDSDSPETAPTTAQLQKCSEFLGWWYDYKGFDPNSSASILNQAGTEWVTLPRICGHKDVNPGGTTCPGTTLYALLPDIRTSTNQVILDCSTPSDIEAPTTSISTDRNWYNSNFEVNFSDADNSGGSGINHSFYQIMDFDGTEWRANATEGFFNDNFTTTIHSEWTALWGNWSINAEHLLQTDESSTNTNIYASLTQEAGNIYLYHWKQKISGSGSNKRSGMHFFCSDPTQTGRLESYMVYLRADGNTAEIYKYMNNSYETANGGFFTSGTYTIDPDIWYDVKVILNTNTGEISLYVDDNLAATTIDPSPLTTGNSISPRTGGCQTEYDDIKVYKTRENTITVLPAENTDADIRYQSVSVVQEAGRIRTLLIDNADNWSESISKNVFTDFDIPVTEISVEETWQTEDFTTSFTDTDDLSGIEKSFYNVSDFNGLKWSSNQNLGFAFNDFDAEIGYEWTSQIGTWSISDNCLAQTNETEANTNLWSYLQQDLSNRYMYVFDMKISGADANKRAGFHYFCDDPTLSNRGNGYFVWFRLASQDLEFYKVTDNVFSLEKYYDIEISADQWYNIKITFDRITGETYVYMDDILVGEYKDSEPYQSGNYVSFRCGNSIMYVDDFNVLRTRYPDVDISLGSSEDAIRYQSPSSETYSAKINSIVTDSAKNISQIISKNLLVDWTIPSTVITVNDYDSEDIDTTYILNQISANWTESADINSGIIAYYYAVGTTVGGTDFIDWTNCGLNTDFIDNSVNLTPETVYYISVKAENGAGLFSLVKTSDGVRALNEPVVPVCPEEFEICISEPAFPLSGADPSGGIYSGTGVTAGVFNPANANTGIHTITYTLATESCGFEITVNPLPELTCPADIYIAIDEAPITLEGAVPTGGAYLIDDIPLTEFDPAVFGVGTYTVVYEYTNTPENCTNTCSFSIFVYEPLTLDCPDNISVCFDDTEFTLEGATPPGGIYSGDGVSGAVFNPQTAGLGEHTINYEYETENCTFVITVNPLPEVNCPADIEVYNDDSEFTLAGATPEGGTYSINGSTVSSFDPQIYGEGNYEVIYSYTSNPENCENTCTFNINVIEPIVVACPDNLSVCYNTAPFDLSGATPIGGTYSGNGLNEGTFDASIAGIGEHTITYTYETISCDFIITVYELPEVTCPEDLYVSATASAFPLTGAEPSGGQYSINENPVTYINPASYGTGTYTITYSYTGGEGNCENSCSFNLTIYEPIDISCPSSFSVCKEDTELTLSGATPAGGEYSGNGVSGDIFNPATAGEGEHAITYTYGYESCNFIITVDSIPIVICPENFSIPVNAEPIELNGGEPENGWFEINESVVVIFDPEFYGEGEQAVTYFYQHPSTNCINMCNFVINVTPAVLIEQNILNNVKIYPNPNEGIFIIETENIGSNLFVEITNVHGQILYEQQISDKTIKTSVDISKFSEGVYFVKLSNSDISNIFKLVLFGK